MDAPIGSHSPAAPVADLDSRSFWEGLRRREMRLQCCDDCGRFRFPPMPTCPYCAGADAQAYATPGEGGIYSWIVVHRAFAPEFASQVPYTLVTVSLDEGCRIVGRLESGEPEFGRRVKACFHDHSDWTELRFSVLEGGES